MDKLIYIRDFDDELKNENIDTREMLEITFTFPDDLTVDEFRTICIRMASALGYNQENIEESFGDEPKNTRSSLISQIRKR